MLCATASVYSNFGVMHC